MRRGCVQATWLYPALIRNCGSCVDFPQPADHSQPQGLIKTPCLRIMLHTAN